MINESANTFYLEPGTVLHAQYRINGVIGQGGFGITYDGTDLKLNMHVAIKEYFPNPMANRQITVSMEVSCNANTKGLYEKGMKNFLEEARNMAKYAGEENFVAVHDYFAENNTAYIIMEFVEGQNLKQYLRRNGRLPMDTVMAIAMPVMNALEKIHDRGMIHRDISPSNIMILPDGRVRLLDFGAAKEVSLETINMTTMSAVYKYGYSPIEQLTQGMKQGPYTDIYALCATMYEMLTGTLPPTPFQRAYEGVNLRPISAYGVRIDPAQEAAILRGLEINGADRIQTIRELRAALCGAGQEEGSLQEINNGRRNTVLIAALSSVAAVLVIFLVFLIGTNIFPRKPLGAGESAKTADHTEDQKESENNTDVVKDDSVTEQEAIVQNESVQENTDSTGIETGAAVTHEKHEDGTSVESEPEIVYPEDMPDAIYVYNGHSYAFYDANDYDLTTYSAVSNFCHKQGGHLSRADIWQLSIMRKRTAIYTI